MRRGSVCWVNLEGAIPPEFGTVCPGLVVSNSEQNALLHTVVVVPISTRPGEIWPLRLGLDMPDGRRSFVVLAGIRQVSKQRLMTLIGQAPAGFLSGLDEALTAYLTG